MISDPLGDPLEELDDRGREAAVHLQRAALEFIEAARLLLDLAEEAVREPANVVSVVSDTLGSLATATGMRVPSRDHRDRAAGDAKAEAQDDAKDDAKGAAARRPRVEHIRIS